MTLCQLVEQSLPQPFSEKTDGRGKGRQLGTGATTPFMPQSSGCLVSVALLIPATLSRPLVSTLQKRARISNALWLKDWLLKSGSGEVRIIGGLEADD